MKLTHVGISNLRSIGEDFVTIDLTKKINILVGANNCGKSNVMRALEFVADRTGKRQLAEIDRHRRTQNSRFRFIAECDANDSPPIREAKKIEVSWTWPISTPNVIGSSLRKLEFNVFNSLMAEFTHEHFTIRNPREESWQNAERGIGAAITRKLLDSISPVHVVPQFRKIGQETSYGLDGSGVIRLLAAWHHPEIGKDADNERFNKVQTLVRLLLESPHIGIEVSHKHDTIIVSHQGMRLALDSFGTGIHELIILAIAVLSLDDAIVCIEEPEIHLHPLLQRRFLEFLRKETNNHYVITTHSPALIAPNPETAVTHLWLENGATKSRLIETTEHSLGALRDLGARASDILQANSVIWVEGPSDRIYLNRWLELLYPDQFREGIDYTIMFYGGRLLSHVSLAREDAEPEDDTEDANDLVHLLRINQHSAIVIDSDRRKSTDRLNATKLRVQEQCTASNVLCWITDGREIENYLPASVLKATFAELSGCTPEIKLLPFGSIGEALKKALKKSWPRSNYYDQAKPKMARLISAQMSKDHLTPDIIGWLGKLVRVIRHETP